MSPLKERTLDGRTEGYPAHAGAADEPAMEPNTPKALPKDRPRGQLALRPPLQTSPGLQGQRCGNTTTLRRPHT